MKIGEEFFCRDVLKVAPELLGKKIVRKFANGTIKKFIITEIEAYGCEEDLACHASKGRTKRTEVMCWQGGYIYVFLIYGMHFMLNFVTAEKNNPQAILIRGVDQIIGPGKVSKALEIDINLNKKSLVYSNEIWLENSGIVANYKTKKRIGIDYAGDLWKNKAWRYILTNNELFDNVISDNNG